MQSILHKCFTYSVHSLLKIFDTYYMRRVAHDCTIPAVLQSTSLRLLYNLIETIFQRRADPSTSEQYRALLSTVLECFVRKLGTLRKQVPSIIR